MSTTLYRGSLFDFFALSHFFQTGKKSQKLFIDKFFNSLSQLSKEYNKKFVVKKGEIFYLKNLTKFNDKEHDYVKLIILMHFLFICLMFSKKDETFVRTMFGTYTKKLIRRWSGTE